MSLRPADPLGAIVLAGGRSTRMGCDKASLTVGGRSTLARVVAALGTVCDEIVLVARRGQTLPPLEPLPARVRLRHAHDEVEGLGPLAGLAAGLAVLALPRAFASACDTPFLRPAFVRAVADALGSADAAVPEDAPPAGAPAGEPPRLHPLAAAWRRDPALAAARALLAVGRRRPVFLLETLAHRRLPAETLRAADPDLRSLGNMNTPADHAAAEALAAARRHEVELPGEVAARAGAARLVAEGATLRELLLDLEARAPALAGAVLDGGVLAPPWTAALDGAPSGGAVYDAPLPLGVRVRLGAAPRVG